MNEILMEDLTVMDVNNRITTHEAVCAERYQQLMDRMGRVEHVILAAAGAIMLVLLALLTHKLWGV